MQLMGFGHRVYKNYDPRARDRQEDRRTRCSSSSACSDPLLDIALQLEEVALADDYFVERKLYPNVDFYTGLIYQAMGFPTEMFTVLFAIGRLPGLDRPVARDDRRTRTPRSAARARSTSASPLRDYTADHRPLTPLPRLSRNPGPIGGPDVAGAFFADLSRWLSGACGRQAVRRDPAAASPLRDESGAFRICVQSHRTTGFTRRSGPRGTSRRSGRRRCGT